ncbi:MAG: hypothetical protein K9I68_10850 [Bacteroidales bacterium]|nr:hypothetical protein [Bacteroidales bacterium]MCF8338192.1 hypothetical protein [Bacteroidales bacterium]
MQSTLDTYKTERPAPRNTLKRTNDNKQPEPQNHNTESTAALFIKALKVIFRWSSLVILINHLLKKAGWTPRNKNPLDHFQNRLYEKLENFFGY